MRHSFIYWGRTKEEAERSITQICKVCREFKNFLPRKSSCPGVWSPMQGVVTEKKYREKYAI